MSFSKRIVFASPWPARAFDGTTTATAARTTVKPQAVRLPSFPFFASLMVSVMLAGLNANEKDGLLQQR